jgi:hypothetical protein
MVPDGSSASTGQARRIKSDAEGQITGERAFLHGGAGLTELCAWLLTTTGAESAAIAVAIEENPGLGQRVCRQ